MAKVTFLVCLFLIQYLIQIEGSTSCGKNGRGLRDITKIVGGEDAEEDAWPWQVALMNGSHLFCGGSLVSEKYIVTAAHCFENISDWKEIKVGYGSKKKDKLTKFIHIKQNDVNAHNEYDNYTKEYDIAIINLNKSIESVTPKIKSVLLNDKNDDLTDKECFITGWGDMDKNNTEPNILQQAKVPIVKRETCQKEYCINITENMLCAGGKGVNTYFGDSGGPLVCKNYEEWYLTGITNGGIGCAETYNFFANVANLYDWIKQNTES